MIQINSKDNYISVAKAIGIILMVIGHSGCPKLLRDFIYTFHMPLFFLCSGYFFKEIVSLYKLKGFFLKKLRGLYLPYLKWSVFFILLHNVFFRCNIYNSYSHSTLYSIQDFAIQLIKAGAMTDFELVIKPFWFIKALLYASLSIAILSYIKVRLFCRIKCSHILLLFFFLSFILKIYTVKLPLLGDISIIAMSICYFSSGIVYRQYENKLSYSIPFLLVTFLLVFVGCAFFAFNDMKSVPYQDFFPYYFLSMSGIYMTFSLSKKIEETRMCRYFYYVGRNTMPIFALHLLVFKLGNAIKIWYFDLPPYLLSSHTAIYDHNGYFWLVYSFLGISFPLILRELYIFTLRLLHPNSL